MRERLTGAVILVAAASILVPEIISGPGGDAPSRAEEALAEAGPPLTTYELSIDPARRDGSRVETARDPQAIAQAVPPPVTENVVLPGDVLSAAESTEATSEHSAADADATVGRVTASDSQTPAAGAAASATNSAPATARTTPAPAPTPSATPARPAPATKAPATAAAQPAPAPAKPAAPAAASATGKWWVQLGSFSSEQNAQALARKLREAGYSIDVSRVRSNGKDLHRVRAGPVNDRAAAGALRTRLAAAGQQGTLVAP